MIIMLLVSLWRANKEQQLAGRNLTILLIKWRIQLSVQENGLPNKSHASLPHPLYHQIKQGLALGNSASCGLRILEYKWQI